ncbi:7,8-dihydropterin-6-methyl-4-(beta-D-ribofuranosyl)-aminobenzene-5'-phosphate synthase [Candidatus Lokiarchaeum ossiferum]
MMNKITILHNEYPSFKEESAGFSVLIQIDSSKILFDTSLKNDVKLNAQQASISLTGLDYVILSHSHYDHTDGLKFLDFDQISHLLAHPDCFTPKFATHDGKEMYIGCPFYLPYLQREMDVILTTEPFWVIPEKMVFLGEIPRLNDFEAQNPLGYDEHHKQDFVMEDSAVVIKTSQGLAIISGCSHAGICNIVEYAKQICQENRIYMILGGFHLFEDHLIPPTVAYFQAQSITHLYPAHCLSDKAFIALQNIGGKRISTLETLQLP